MYCAEGHRELIADLAAKRSGLRDSKMSLRRRARADQTELARHKALMFAVPLPFGLGRVRTLLSIRPLDVGTPAGYWREGRQCRWPGSR